MAETKQEKRTFKYGDKTYLVDDFLRAHADYKNSFLEFAKSQGHYDPTALEGLVKAMNHRASAAENGRAFTADGRLDDDLVDNVTVEVNRPRKYGLTRKTRYVDQDNTEWAKHYMHKLIGNLKEYNPDSDKGKWDIDKYGFGAYLTGQGLNADEIFNTLDRNGKKGTPRSFDQRHAELRKHLANYKTWLEGKGFDFTKNDNEWDDDFISTLDGVINNQSWDNNSLKSSLRKLGGGEGFTRAFTSDRWDAQISNEELRERQAAAARAASERRAAEAEDKAWHDEVSRRYGIYESADRRSGQMNHYMGSDYNFDLTDDDINAHLASVGITKGTAAEKAYWDKLDADYAANPYDASVAQLILPIRARQGKISTIENGDYAGWSYDPTTVNTDRQSVMAFDKGTGRYEEVFIGNAAADWKKVKDQFNVSRGKKDPSAQYRADGGVLEFQTGGSISSYEFIQDFKKQQNAARAAKTGNSEDVQKARDRVVSTGEAPLTSDDPTLAQPEAGFTGAEIARLASIAADITSIFLDPVTGVAVGLGSTLTNFGADIADDGFQWEDVKNLGINIGFDLLGAIPILGDALGTGAKIAKTAIKWAPRAMAGLAAFQGVANFDGMMGSWQKLTSGDKEQKMTVQDWRNIAQSISLLTGGVRATRGKVAQNKMKKAAKVDDVVGVNVRDKATGEVKQVLVDGDTAKNIRAAKGDKTKIESELGSLEQFKGQFGDNGTLEVSTHRGGLQKPWEKVTNADGTTSRQLRGLRSEGRAQVSDVYDFSKIPAEGVSRGLRIPGVSDALNNWHQSAVRKLSGTPPQVNARGAMKSADIDAEVQRLQGTVDSEIASLKTSMSARTKKYNDISKQLAPERTKLNDLRAKLGTAPDVATLQTNKAKQEAALAALDTQIAQRKQMLQQAEAELNKLQNKKRVSKKNQKAHKAALASARGRVQGHKAALQGYEASKSSGIVAIDTINKQLQMHAELPGVEASVKKLEGIQRNLDRSNHTHAFNRLQTLLADYQSNYGNIGGRNLNWDMNTILQNAGIRNAFHAGGSINRNKINKFLNYAKG